MKPTSIGLGRATERALLSLLGVSIKVCDFLRPAIHSPRCYANTLCFRNKNVTAVTAWISTVYCTSVLQATFLPGLQEMNGSFGFLLLSQTRSRYCCSWRIALSCGCEIGWEDQVTGLHHLHIRATCPNFPLHALSTSLSRLVNAPNIQPQPPRLLEDAKTLLGSVCNCAANCPKDLYFTSDSRANTSRPTQVAHKHENAHSWYSMWQWALKCLMFVAAMVFHIFPTCHSQFMWQFTTGSPAKVFGTFSVMCCMLCCRDVMRRSICILGRYMFANYDNYDKIKSAFRRRRYPANYIVLFTFTAFEAILIGLVSTASTSKTRV